ncbi:MAG: hypothetical protein JRE29_13520, partial [Deltaproteobacteria bacterium]|nr:hypothetical protein [Deltaproteobacteria bacterium]
MFASGYAGRDPGTTVNRQLGTVTKHKDQISNFYFLISAFRERSQIKHKKLPIKKVSEMASIDEQVLRAAKEIVVKFIEGGRVSPA